ncbi:MAG: hypothetical protein KDK41_18150 [Leptospiraceae bacterium]|nr:hypothetical protein [Leptospiraceae bacterium]
MNIGIVDYLNAWPYRKSLEFLRDAKMPAFESLKIFPDIPSKLASRLLEGKLDLALISSIEYWRHREQLQFLPTFCIAAHAEVQSIRLITSKDNAERSFEEALALIDTIYCDIFLRPAVPRQCCYICIPLLDLNFREFKLLTQCSICLNHAD